MTELYPRFQESMVHCDETIVFFCRTDTKKPWQRIKCMFSFRRNRLGFYSDELNSFTCQSLVKQIYKRLILITVYFMVYLLFCIFFKAMLMKYVSTSCYFPHCVRSKKSNLTKCANHFDFENHKINFIYDEFKFYDDDNMATAFHIIECLCRMLCRVKKT